MKKIFFTIVLVMLLVTPLTVRADYLCISSGLLTSDAIILTGKYVLCGVEIITNGAADATAVLYDNTAASGTVLFKGVVLAASQFGGMAFPYVQTDNGIYLDITGAGAAVIIYYRVK